MCIRDRFVDLVMRRGRNNAGNNVNEGDNEGNVQNIRRVRRRIDRSPEAVLNQKVAKAIAQNILPHGFMAFDVDVRVRHGMTLRQVLRRDIEANMNGALHAPMMGKSYYELIRRTYIPLQPE